MRVVSGILFPFRGDCHFSSPTVTRRLKQPTQKTRTSSPFSPCGPASSYLVLQPIRFTPPGCHHPVRELLPHVFTLTCRETFRETSLQQAVIFCGTCCYPFGHLPVGKYGALCCPDFPRAGFPGARQSLSSRRQRYGINTEWGMRNAEFLQTGAGRKNHHKGMPRNRVPD